MKTNLLKTSFLRKLLAVMTIAGAVWLLALPVYATIRDVSNIGMLTTSINNAVTGDGIRLTADITNPNSPYTFGSERPTPFTAATGLSVGNIKYEGRNGKTYTESETAPTEAGEYTANVEVGTYTLTKYLRISLDDSHIHDGIAFKAWNETTSLPTTAGSYYLTQNVTLSNTWNVSGVVNLCLNGKMIKGNGTSRDITVPSDATLNLYDCDEYTTQHDGYVDSDSLWHYGSGTGTLKTIYGGIVTGGIADKGGGVYVGGVFNMYGGTIAGCGNGNWCGGVIY